MRRRSFLKGAGTVTVLVVGGGVWRAYDQGVFSVGRGPAYEPWNDWRSPQTGPLALVSAAILAASPHNTQPWLFKVADSRIQLYADIQRNTGALDPFLRELHIGLGCALENLALAAKANGYAARITLPPAQLQGILEKPQAELVAQIELQPAAREPSELYEAIPRRHTNRAPYDLQKPLPADVQDRLLRLAEPEPDLKVFLFPGQQERDKIVAMILKANDEVYADPKVDEGSRRWVRIEWRDVQKYHDGLTVDAFGLPPLASAVIKTVPASVLNRIFAKKGNEVYAELLKATPVFGILAVRDRYDRAQSLTAGRLWQRIHLWLTAQGLAARPVNEVVELVDHERSLGRDPHTASQLTEIIVDASWQPTFMFRFGYPSRAALASPRRGVREVLV